MFEEGMTYFHFMYTLAALMKLCKDTYKQSKKVQSKSRHLIYLIKPIKDDDRSQTLDNSY